MSYATKSEWAAAQAAEAEQQARDTAAALPATLNWRGYRDRDLAVSAYRERAAKMARLAEKYAAHGL